MKNSSGSFCSKNDLALVHEDHPVGDLAGKTHLVGDAQHGHAFLGQFDHGVEHFLDHFRVERRGRLVKQHDARVHAQLRAIATRCC
jgi:hypothetical protein